MSCHPGPCRALDKHCFSQEFLSSCWCDAWQAAARTSAPGSRSNGCSYSFCFRPDARDGTELVLPLLILDSGTIAVHFRLFGLRESAPPRTQALLCISALAEAPVPNQQDLDEQYGKPPPTETPQFATSNLAKSQELISQLLEISHSLCNIALTMTEMIALLLADFQRGFGVCTSAFGSPAVFCRRPICQMMQVTPPSR